MFTCEDHRGVLSRGFTGSAWQKSKDRDKKILRNLLQHDSGKRCKDLNYIMMP